MTYNLNYDNLIHLDAENLAEVGIKDAYESLIPHIKEYISHPVQIAEILDNEVPSYAIVAGEDMFSVYSPGLDEDGADSWGRATYVLFTIVNNQLGDSTHRFYALYGGNDLGGMFLTPAQADAVRSTLEKKMEWPYIPNLDYPSYGQYH